MTTESALERIANWLETSGGKLSRTQVQEMIEFARGAASDSGAVRRAALEEAALVVERWSLPTIQAPSMWLINKAGIAAEIRALADEPSIGEPI